MATFDTTRTTYGSATVAGQVTRFFHNALSSVQNWNEARITRNALSALTDRELEDIGLSRGSIETFIGR
ncbi:DUF1127 domain-containing protein [Ascidiaceihabitans sp.]|uniref:DUF1127 domain-containing protein n=1 Tax=Ascidiaceihabitans sp. TaxID=1872644 RepID=UPI003296949B